MRVVSIPMRVRFRGVTVREAALLRRPVRLGRVLALPGVRAAPSRRAGWPPPSRPGGASGRTARRDSIPVNATVPAVAAGRGGGRAGPLRRRHDRQGQGRRARPEPARTTLTAWPRCATRWARAGGSGWTPTAAGRCGEATDALRRLAAYGLEYAEQPCAEVSELRELRLALARSGHRRAGGGGRVDPQGRGPDAGGPRGGGRPRRRQGRAARWGVAAPWRSSPTAGCRRWSPRRWTPPWGWRPGSRWRRPCPSCRSPAGWARWPCWRATCTDAPLLPRGGALPVGRVGGRRGPARAVGGAAGPASSGGPRGCGTAGRSWR